ncbi:HypC/HybG/HupF family hydrogenase formation chaperone [Candidatus Bipolaricaulota bacterium]
MCLAAPARVIEVAEKTAVVDYNGVRTTARLDALPDRVSPGDYVLIHTGFAIRRLSPEDGEETLRLFDELAASLAAESPAKPAQNAAQATPELYRSASHSDSGEEEPA